MKYNIYNENCIIGATNHFEDNQMDLIICDPPFGIELLSIKFGRGRWSLERIIKKN